MFPHWPFLEGPSQHQKKKKIGPDKLCRLYFSCAICIHTIFLRKIHLLGRVTNQEMTKGHPSQAPRAGQSCWCRRNKDLKPLVSHKSLHCPITNLHFHFTIIQMRLLSPTSVTGTGLTCQPPQLGFRVGLADPAPLLKEQRGHLSSD